MELKKKNVLITNIQRYSLQDGPGFRTTVFLKGCPLRCPWCHNPETQDSAREIQFDLEKCTACGACVQVCLTKAICRVGNNIIFNREVCSRCGLCIEVCSNSAREWSGQEMTIDEIVTEVKGDEMFYTSSGGGVTISGGDPLYFPQYTKELSRCLKEELLHVAVETAAFCKWSYLEELCQYTNLFLIDLKTMDSEKYRKVIGTSLEVVQQNIERLVDAGASIRVRVPVIPGFNDSEGDYEAIAAYLGKLRNRLKGVDILPFHSYAWKKYKLLGRWDCYQYKNTESLQPEDVIDLAKKLKEAGFTTANSSLTIGGLT
ncbi:MAG: benzylsuccinate synthase subunit delta [Firmicutes bacterium HGW-Firmicutes-12]|jgi:pyruvate formate lyase activating enzyme|nr:MAG: benzylsuccinate synthase subunit delta [Firmicutes bacterium HGW-Firmicutes-12]